MKKTLIYLASAAVLCAACHRSSGSLQRKDQQHYDVVQEGQASGVTSTINAPGETTPPPVSMTGTNYDTTSNFTLPQVSSTDTSTQPPGTIAGTLPSTTGGTTMPGYPRDTPPRPRRVRPTPPTDTTSTSVEGAPPSTSTVPPTTDTAPPPPTDTQPPPPPTTTT
ncbi:MAG TPA: hypothetical protein VGK31_12700 [Thermoanaerobaculia bacterium]|jgi:hypothetical protein